MRDHTSSLTATVLILDRAGKKNENNCSNWNYGGCVSRAECTAITWFGAEPQHWHCYSCSMGLQRGLRIQDFAFPVLAKMVFTQKQRTVQKDTVPAQIWGLKQGHKLRSWIAVHTCTKQQRDMVLAQRDISCLESGWAQLWPAVERILQVTTNEIKAPEELTWTFWISSDLRCYQLTVPSPCSPFATYCSNSFSQLSLAGSRACSSLTSTSLRITCREANPHRKLSRGWSPEIPHSSGFPGTGCMRGMKTMVNNKMRLHW